MSGGILGKIVTRDGPERGPDRRTLGMGVQGFERRLERLVEGAFGKAFRSGLQPVEIARKLLRRWTTSATMGVDAGHGRAQRLPRLPVRGGRRPLRRLRRRPRARAGRGGPRARPEEGYHFLGPVAVQLVRGRG